MYPKDCDLLAMFFNQGYSTRTKIPSYEAGLKPNQKAVSHP